MSNPLLVCIVAAGRGTRMGTSADLLHKGLLPLGQKAIISHILDRFPDDAEVVVAVGHLADQVIDYLALAHPERKFAFARVDPYQGPGSGPGVSLLQCAPWLQRPFFFVTCDTLWEGVLDCEADTNWFGAAPVPDHETARYCNFELSDRRIVAIADKVAVAGPQYEAFIGLGFVKDVAAFWASLGRDRQTSREHQFSEGMEALVASGRAFARRFEWTDTGTADTYRSALARYHDYDFSKIGESLYILNGRTIKFFADERIVENRLRRAEMKPGVFPPDLCARGQFYSYRYVPGKTLYELDSPSSFHQLLEWLETEIWKPIAVDALDFSSRCMQFYRDKTYQRLAAYEDRHGPQNSQIIVNSAVVPPAAELLCRVPWQWLADGVPVFFHGDLQFDNVVHDPVTDRFVLLDWRQDFAGMLECGDLYYDFAKLRGGIILNYDLIKRRRFKYDESPTGVTIDFEQRYLTPQYVATLDQFIESRGFDLRKVRLLVGLIYLNMAPLHQQPFDKFLYALGCRFLTIELPEEPSPTAGVP